MILRLSVSAKIDLQGISQYTIQHWGYEQEDKYLDLIYSRLEELLENPTDCKTRDELYPGACSSKVGKHIVFFRLQGQTLLVARILHLSMDFIRHLEDTHFEDF